LTEHERNVHNAPISSKRQSDFQRKPELYTQLPTPQITPQSTPIQSPTAPSAPVPSFRTYPPSSSSDFQSRTFDYQQKPPMDRSVNYQQLNFRHQNLMQFNEQFQQNFLNQRPSNNHHIQVMSSAFNNNQIPKPQILHHDRSALESIASVSSNQQLLPVNQYSEMIGNNQSYMQNDQHLGMNNSAIGKNINPMSFDNRNESSQPMNNFGNHQFNDNESVRGMPSSFDYSTPYTKQEQFSFVREKPNDRFPVGLRIDTQLEMYHPQPHSSHMFNEQHGQTNKQDAPTSAPILNNGSGVYNIAFNQQGRFGGDN
jgi:hypothetical protein